MCRYAYIAHLYVREYSPHVGEHGRKKEMETLTKERETEIEHVKRLVEKIKPLMDETPAVLRLSVLGYVLTAETMISLAEVIQDNDKDQAARTVQAVINICANVCANVSLRQADGIAAFLSDVQELALAYSGAQAPRKPEAMYA
jgi:hypothetical protein